MAVSVVRKERTMEKEKTAITEKYTMTVPEAAVYFGIGQKKLRRLCENHTIDSFAKKEMEKFLKFVHDDNCYYKYYEAFYILFHTGFRISEVCGLTVKDLNMEKRIVQMITGTFAVSGIMVNWNIRWTNDCSFRALLPEFSAHGVHLKEKKKPRKRAQNAALCGV